MESTYLVNGFAKLDKSGHCALWFGMMWCGMMELGEGKGGWMGDKMRRGEGWGWCGSSGR